MGRRPHPGASAGQLTASAPVFVILDIGTRRVHWNLTDHPTAEWTIRQFRNGLPLDRVYRFLIHDRDSIFGAPSVEEALRSMSLQVLKTAVRAPQTNLYCKRFIGTARRKCLDWMIPLGKRLSVANIQSGKLY
jgi:putative transposase